MAKDIKINFSPSVETVKTLPESQINFAADYQKKWYGEAEQIPVERFFDRND